MSSAATTAAGAADRKGKGRAVVFDSEEEELDGDDAEGDEDVSMADADEDALAAAMLLPAGSTALAASSFSTSAAAATGIDPALHPRIKVPRLTLKLGSASAPAAEAASTTTTTTPGSTHKRAPGRPHKKLLRTGPDREPRDSPAAAAAAPYAPWLAPRPDIFGGGTSPHSSDDERRDDDDDDDDWDPYGGLLSAQEADGTGRRPDRADRERFREAKRAFELQERMRAAAIDAAAKGGAAAAAGAGAGAGRSPAPGNAAVLPAPGPGTPSAGAHELRPARTATPSGAGTATPFLAESLSSLPRASTSASLPSASLTAAAGAGASLTLPPATAGGLPIRPITHLRIGEFELKTWYQAPFPDEYTRVADGRLWVCEWCLKYMKSGFESERHAVRFLFFCLAGWLATRLRGRTGADFGEVAHRSSSARCGTRLATRSTATARCRSLRSTAARARCGAPWALSLSRASRSAPRADSARPRFMPARSTARTCASSPSSSSTTRRCTTTSSRSSSTS